MIKLKCPKCGGTGKLYKPVPERKLPTVRQIQCWGCRGTGKMFIPETPAEELSLAKSGRISKEGLKSKEEEVKK